MEKQDKMTGADGALSSPALPGNSGSAMLDHSGKFWMCSQCHTSGGSKMFHSRQAANGHMKVHTKRAKPQAEGRKKKRKEESRSPSRKQSKSHQASVGSMGVDNNQPQWPVQHVHEEKEKEPARSNSSAMAENRASLLAAEDARRKEKHRKIDLNKAPVDDENDDGKGA